MIEGWGFYSIHYKNRLVFEEWAYQRPLGNILYSSPDVGRYQDEVMTPLHPLRDRSLENRSALATDISHTDLDDVPVSKRVKNTSAAVPPISRYR